MKNKVLVFLVIALSAQVTFGQSQTIGINSYYGANPNDNFTYEGTTLGNYSLGWYQTANAAEARISGFDGIKLFTHRNLRLHINKEGNVGIGMEPIYPSLAVNGGVLSNVPASNTLGIYGVKIVNNSSANGSQHGLYVQVEQGGGNIMRSSINGGATKDAFTIKNNGNVGIGTASPSQKLEIKDGSLLINSDPYAYIKLQRSNGSHVTMGVSSGTEEAFLSTKGQFKILTQGESYPKFFLNETGNVGIGTTNPDAKLAVNGDIHAKEVKVDLNVPAPDYVFKNDYQLRSLSDVKSYIKANSHLPEVPSAKEIEENGIDLGEMNMLLLKKIEELTLYQIELMEKVEKQSEEIAKLKSQIEDK